jgi:hypothetical protein
VAQGVNPEFHSQYSRKKGKSDQKYSLTGERKKMIPENYSKVLF